MYTVKVVPHPSGELRHVVADLQIWMAVVTTWPQGLFAIEDQWNNVPCDTDSTLSQKQVTVPCTPNRASGIYLKKKIKYRAYPVTKIQKHDCGKKAEETLCNRSG